MTTAPTSPRELATLLSPAAQALGVALPPAAYDALDRFAARLIEWNERINLSGARDLESLAREHVADALALVPHLPASGRCIDVGSGAGLPGLVLALARPDLEFVLLEPRHKRRAFLAATIRELAISNARAVGERVETHLAGHAGRYDFAVARAVFPLVDWIAIGRSLVGGRGVVAGLSGGSPPADLPPGAETHRYDTGAGPRTIVLLRIR